MNVERFRELCLALPDATERVQWGHDLVFKIGGKMFAVACLTPGEAASFKCTPEVFAELIEREGVKPAAYAARYHWITLETWDALPDREVRRLVKDSYEMVLTKNTRSTKNTKNRKAATRKKT